MVKLGRLGEENRSPLIISAIAVIIVVAAIVIVILYYQGAFYKNLQSVSNMIELSSAPFTSSPAFNITYNLSYSQTNVTNIGTYKSEQFMTVSKFGSYLKFVMSSHTIVVYYNSTQDKNVSVAVPVLRLIIYNDSGMTNC